MARLLSVNVGLPRDIEWQGKTVHTAVWKAPVESGTAHLEEAVAAYRAALEERTRDRVPLAWAMTQMNLGNALQVLGERESGTAHLDEAVAASHNRIWPRASGSVDRV